LRDYFPEEPFGCRCGCGLNAFDPAMRTILNEIRDELNVPLKINSGCRCPNKNAAVGGAFNSAHLQGPDFLCHAVDVQCYTGQFRGRLMEAFQRHGVRRFEVSEVHLHADNATYLPVPALVSKRFLS